MVFSKPSVETVHVFWRREERETGFSASEVGAGGRCLKSSVDEEKIVKPVSAGEGVTAVNNWKLWEERLG